MGRTQKRAITKGTDVRPEWIKVSTTEISVPVRLTDAILDLAPWRIRYA